MGAVMGLLGTWPPITRKVFTRALFLTLKLTQPKKDHGPSDPSRENQESVVEMDERKHAGVRKKDEGENKVEEQVHEEEKGVNTLSKREIRRRRRLGLE